MNRTLWGVAALVWLAACGPGAGPGNSAGAPKSPAAAADHPLRDARAAYGAGDYEAAAALLAPLTVRAGASAAAARGRRLDRHDRAEAWRVYGLAMFFLGNYSDAKGAFVHYLKLDPDGRLDPTLVPPEAVGFFEEVRAVHAAMLRRYRPKPKRYWALNLLPPLGQLQNRDRKKSYILAGTGAALVATNLASYAVLNQWCRPGTNVCRSGDQERSSQARMLRALNWSSGVLLLGLFTYGVADGFLHYHSGPTPVSIGVIPSPHGTGVVVHARF